MITLYTAAGPNGHKISIALEELELPYRVESIDIFGKGPDEAFMKLNPNGKIPVITDDETGMTIFESCAILMYLSEKTGKLMPQASAGRWEAIQWLFMQAASFGPMLGQRAHFERFAPQSIDYAITRYRQETERLMRLLDKRLEEGDYICGEYSMVDIAYFGWINPARRLGFFPVAVPRLEAWFDRILARPAVARGITIPAKLPF